ncbi:hypothetical protein P1J78_01625 [Psychromarinibacter sp. C21-152]|uniref:Uncharacterized protein n=1 Tax=Psychromarinibacter sediminicola TaxID=3033385 RepID=A0AAE3T6L4_9RHOB|nr:hypothetical protein [Psychromarinibacter sediminicola]MDF0599420.1 hypothetical protein [Psychromarinibacter sediminicola]
MSKRPSIAELRAPFVGRWRIVEADCYDRDYLDLAGEACLIVPPEGRGEMSFGALIAGLDFSFAPGALFFDWHGADELDESAGEGVMELTGEGKAEIELGYSYGDAAVPQAIKMLEP